MNRPAPRLTNEHLEQLAAYDWPGNIRELQNVVERAVILAQGGRLRFEFPAADARAVAPGRKTTTESPAIMTRAEWKRREPEEITKALTQSRGKVFGPGGAAAILGMKPTTLLSRIKALGIARRP